MSKQGVRTQFDKLSDVDATINGGYSASPQLIPNGKSDEIDRIGSVMPPDSPLGPLGSEPVYGLPVLQTEAPMHGTDTSASFNPGSSAGGAMPYDVPSQGPSRAHEVAAAAGSMPNYGGNAGYGTGPKNLDEIGAPTVAGFGEMSAAGAAQTLSMPSHMMPSSQGRMGSQALADLVAGQGAMPAKYAGISFAGAMTGASQEAATKARTELAMLINRTLLLIGSESPDSLAIRDKVLKGELVEAYHALQTDYPNELAKAAAQLGIDDEDEPSSSAGANYEGKMPPAQWAHLQAVVNAAMSILQAQGTNDPNLDNLIAQGHFREARKALKTGYSQAWAQAKAQVGPMSAAGYGQQHPLAHLIYATLDRLPRNNTHVVEATWEAQQGLFDRAAQRLNRYFPDVFQATASQLNMNVSFAGMELQHPLARLVYATLSMLPEQDDAALVAWGQAQKGLYDSAFSTLENYYPEMVAQAEQRLSMSVAGCDAAGAAHEASTLNREELSRLIVRATSYVPEHVAQAISALQQRGELHEAYKVLRLQYPQALTQASSDTGISAAGATPPAYQMSGAKGKSGLKHMTAVVNAAMTLLQDQGTFSPAISQMVAAGNIKGAHAALKAQYPAILAQAKAQVPAASAGRSDLPTEQVQFFSGAAHEAGEMNREDLSLLILRAASYVPSYDQGAIRALQQRGELREAYHQLERLHPKALARASAETGISAAGADRTNDEKLAHLIYDTLAHVPQNSEPAVRATWAAQQGRFPHAYDILNTHFPNALAQAEARLGFSITSGALATPVPVIKPVGDMISSQLELGAPLGEATLGDFLGSIQGVEYGDQSVGMLTVAMKLATSDASQQVTTAVHIVADAEHDGAVKQMYEADRKAGKVPDVDMSDKDVDVYAKRVIIQAIGGLLKSDPTLATVLAPFKLIDTDNSTKALTSGAAAAPGANMPAASATPAPAANSRQQIVKTVLSNLQALASNDPSYQNIMQLYFNGKYDEAYSQIQQWYPQPLMTVLSSQTAGSMAGLSIAGMSNAMPDYSDPAWLDWAGQHPAGASAKLVQSLEGFFNGDTKKLLTVLNAHSQGDPTDPRSQVDPRAKAVWNQFAQAWKDLHPNTDWANA